MLCVQVNFSAALSSDAFPKKTQCWENIIDETDRMNKRWVFAEEACESASGSTCKNFQGWISYTIYGLPPSFYATQTFFHVIREMTSTGQTQDISQLNGVISPVN